MFIRINKAHFLKTVAQNRKCFALLNLARNKENENKKSLRHYKTLSIKHLKPCRILQDNETKWRREREKERKEGTGGGDRGEECYPQLRELELFKWISSKTQSWLFFAGEKKILFIYIYFFGSLFKIFFLFLHVYMCTHIQHFCHMHIYR